MEPLHYLLMKTHGAVKRAMLAEGREARTYAGTA